MTDNNKLHDTILDMEASLSTNLSGYSMWHYGADIHGITRETLKNAVEALKAQEPVEPIQKQSKHGWFFYCQKCGTVLNDMARPKYCNECGQAVKWE